jgi:hypothetical protein
MLAMFGSKRDTAVARSGPERLESLRRHALISDSVVEYAPLVLPWVVRTPEYTQALHGPGGANHQEACYHRSLSAVLHLSDPPHWQFVIHEWVLRTPWGPADAMVAQLEYLLSLAARWSISVHLVPIRSGPVTALTGPFAVFRSTRWPTAVYREDGNRGVLSDEPPETSYYLAAEGRIRAAALGAEQSVRFIGDLAERLRRHPNTDPTPTDAVA